MGDALNDAVADKLEAAARLLAEQGANPFRVRSYHRAARTLRQLRDPVSAVLTVEGLEGLERSWKGNR